MHFTGLTALLKYLCPNFSGTEIACRHCGEIYIDIAALIGIQAVRNMVGRPVNISSAHRCSLHNARVGGAPLSGHLGLAFDILTDGHNLVHLWKSLKKAGFTGFGYYENFIHVDMGKSRFWSGSETAKLKWRDVIRKANNE